MNKKDAVITYEFNDLTSMDVCNMVHYCNLCPADKYQRGDECEEKLYEFVAEHGLTIHIEPKK